MNFIISDYKTDDHYGALWDSSIISFFKAIHYKLQENWYPSR